MAPTTIKEALAQWEEKNGMKASESKIVLLVGKIPPIEKMDASLSMLGQCERLGLSTNCIEKIANLNGLKNLKILSIGRNNIKSLTGLEPVADTLEQLWCSYNPIERLRGVTVLKKLKVFYMSNCNVKDIGEVQKLADLPFLEEFVFTGNPVAEMLMAENTYKTEIPNILKKLKTLDGVPVIREEDNED